MTKGCWGSLARKGLWGGGKQHILGECIVHISSHIPFHKLLENIPSKAFADFFYVWLQRTEKKHHHVNRNESEKGRLPVALGLR